MSKLLMLIIALFLAVSSASAAQTLNELYRDVKATLSDEQKEDEARKQRFLHDVNKAKADLAAMKKALAEQKARTKALKAQFDTNQEQIKRNQAALDRRASSLRSLFAITKQEARDFSSLAHSAMTATQFEPSRLDAIDALAHSKANPSIDAIAQFWQIYLQELIASGEIARYENIFINPEGKQEQSTLYRLGLFSAFNAHGFLRYDETLGEFVEPNAQPSFATKQIAPFIASYESANAAVLPMLIDPTKGVLLEMLKERATLVERVQQGGVVGYVIVSLGLLTLLFALFKLIMLLRMQRAVTAQTMHNEVDTKNPLGRILQQFKTFDAQSSSESLETQLDSALMQEVPKVMYGLSMIKLIAAVAPLLGLLGTVTGMIETFQAITLFGTGEPKLMAGGISKALVTTVLGLVVAIPLLFVYNILHAKAKAIIEVLTQQSGALIATALQKQDKATV